MARPISGRCFCGAVRFRFSHMPVATRACWCRDCQYLAAGNASINAIFRTEGFEIAGEVSGYESTADSGKRMRRRFCPKCGTPLFSEALGEPGFVAVRVGALDDPAIGRPQQFIWTASAPEWGLTDGALPHCAGQPEPISSD